MMHEARALTGRRGKRFEAASSGPCRMVFCRANEGNQRFRGGLENLSVQMKRIMLGAKGSRLN